VFVSGVETTSVQFVIEYLKGMGKEVMQGEIYEGTVVNVMSFGAFVNILPGKDGLVHVSQMAQGFVSDPGTIVQIGQTVRVWVTEVDAASGKIGLSMLFDEGGQPVVKAREEKSRQDRLAFGGASRRDRFNAPTRGGRDDFRRSNRRR